MYPSDERVSTLVERFERGVAELDWAQSFSRKELRVAMRKRFRYLPVKQQEQVLSADNVSRRQFLSLLGVTGAGMVAAAAGIPEMKQFLDTVTGNISASDGEDIAAKIESSIHSGGTVEVPAGTFRMSPLRLGGNGWTVKGAGVDKTTIVLPSGFSGDFLTITGDEWTFSGMTFDVEQDSSSWEDNASPRWMLQGSDWTFSDIRIKGMVAPNYRGSTLRVKNIPSGTTARLRNLYMLGGSAPPDTASNVGGIGSFSDWSVDGHVVFNNLQMRHWANNSAYIEGCKTCTVKNSFFHNTNVGVRISGGTTVENSVFVKDSGIPKQQWTGGQVMRGLWLNTNKYYPGTIRVVDSDFSLSSAILRGYSGAKVDNHEFENLTVNGNIRVKGPGYIKDSCITGDFSTAEGTLEERGTIERGDCSPRTTAPKESVDAAAVSGAGTGGSGSFPC